MTKKIYFFIGTTAELIKLFPVIREMERRRVRFKIITSGQTDIKFNEVSDWINKRTGDIILPGKANESSVFLFLIWAIRTLFVAPIRLSKEFKRVDKTKSFFIVHGDTVSSLIGAMVAKFFNFKLVHIESGLRSFNFLEPFPEELCRFFVSKLADVHFCPNEWSLNNLSKVGGVKINTYQNTFIESFWLALKSKAKVGYKLSYRRGKYFVLITHRQEHVVFGKEENREAIDVVLRGFDKRMFCIFVTHLTTSGFLKSVKFNFSYWRRQRVEFLPRLTYIDFIRLLREAEFMISDGGGNQEESYYLGLPCLVLRKKTERVEGLEENVILARKNKETIRSFLKNYRDFRHGLVRPKVKPSKIIVDYLLNGISTR